MSFCNLGSEAQSPSENMGISERLKTSGARAVFDHQKIGGETLMDKKFVLQDELYWAQLGYLSPSQLSAGEQK